MDLQLTIDAAKVADREIGVANSRAINNSSVEWLIDELRKMDRDMPGGVVANFHHENFLKIKKDAVGEYRSGEKRFYIQLSFDTLNN